MEPLSGFWVPATAGHGGADAATLAVLTLAGLGSVLLLGLGLAAFVHRRSRSYLLVALALGTLFVRTAVSVLAMVELLPTGYHHLAEHGLDVLMAGLVVAAIYYARTVEERASRQGA